MKQGMFLFSSLGQTGIALVLLMGGFDAQAAPQGAQTAAGRATVSQAGNKTDIWQSTDKAVIDWRSFDIGKGEHTQFHQPSSKSFTLNRVRDTDASVINGKLSANGNIAIVNPNGVYFGSNAKVDVNSLIATTADIDNQRFMRGDLRFDKPGNPDAAVINQGSISVREAGLVGLVAPNVLNDGTITARMGKIQLASGDSFTVDLYGNGLMEVQVSDKVKSQLVSSSGIISADGGTIALTAAAGKNVVNSLVSATGELRAAAVSKKGGKIIIAAEGSNAVKGNSASAKGKKKGESVVVVGKAVLNASGYGKGQTGGQIDITGDYIEVGDDTVLDTSGDVGGGTIRVGGDYQGKGDTPAAKYVYASPFSLALNNAITSGDGGRTIFWSDDTAEFYGNVVAQGGSKSGNGGFVETSGKKNLTAQGMVDLTAPNGNKGTYLLDPDTITILGGFDPLDYSNLVLWLDAADASTITATGNALTQWNDKSPEGNHAYALYGSPNTGTYTLNGKNVIRFNGTNQVLTVYDDDSLDGAAGMTFFALNTPTVTGSPHGIISKRTTMSSTQAYSLFYYSGNKVHADFPASSSRFAGNTSLVSGTTYLVGANYDGTKTGSQRVNLYLQGLLDGTGSAAGATLPNTTSDLFIAALNSNYGQYLSGDIPEILIYRESLPKDQQDVVNQYLSAKWNFALNPTNASNPEYTEAMSSTGFSTFTTDYLKRLSGFADISLLADNGVTLDLQGETLSLDNNRSLTIATTNGNITTASAGTLRTNRVVSGGDITLTATNGSIITNNALTLDAVGGGTIRLTAGSGISTGGNLTVQGDNLILDNTVTGNLTWRSDAATPTATTNAAGSSNIVFEPRSAGRSLTIGANSGADINLSAATIAALRNGFGNHRYGASASGELTNHYANWDDVVSFVSGDDITNEATIAATRTLTANAGGNFTNNAAISNTQNIRIEATGNIILNDTITSSAATQNALVLSAGGNFTNTAGSSALSTTGAGSRWLLYSAGPSGNTRNGLLPTASEFGKTIAANAPATIGAGNRFVYATSTQPTLAYNVDDISVEYGDAIGTLSATYDSGLVGDDTLLNIGLTGAASFSSTYSTGDNAGSYAGAATAAANTLASPLGYTFSFAAGDVTVDKAPLTATLATATPSRQVGQANPAFAITYSGFKLLETEAVLDTAPTASTTATPGSPTGSYDITIAGGTDNNYQISYTNPAGSLTVSAAPAAPSPSKPSPTPTTPTPTPVTPSPSTPSRPESPASEALPATVTRVSQDPRSTQTLAKQAELMDSNPAPQTVEGDEPYEVTLSQQEASLQTLSGMVEIRPEIMQRFKIIKSNVQFQTMTGHSKRGS